jgi:hypothetical protein
MFDVLTLIQGKKKRTQDGWYSFNAPCCHHRGHNVDKRMRGGIKQNGDNWSFHCFNCDFKCSFILGRQFSFPTKQFLGWLGVDESQITRWNLENLRHKDLIEYVTETKQKFNLKFDEVQLPVAELLDENNPKHKRFVDYVNSRGLKATDYPFMVTPDDHGRNNNRIIIPYTYKNKIVGHTSRYLDNRAPKFIKDQQSGFVFGYDLQKPNWEVCIVVEGIFDALSLNALALTHNTISEEQAGLIRKLNRRVIVVPDQDKTGLLICEQALEFGFQVSIPAWGSEVKDVNDAVLKYGKLPTLLSILQNATTSKIKVEMAKRKHDKKL